MKKVLFLILMVIPIMGIQAQKEIKLNVPDKTRGTSVMKALSERRSVREYATRELSLQDLSDLLWAANGINRTDGRRTAPSALNKQDIDIYVIMSKGAYLYLPAKNLLQQIAQGDHRSAVAGSQDYVLEAPVSLVLVSDLSRLGGTDERTKQIASLDAGLVCQNINIFCSSVGLNTVPRITMDQAELKKVLKLKPSQCLMINNPVGYSR